MSDSPKFLNPSSEILIQKNRLPHWEQDGCTYFITFRLADSLPQRLVEEWKRERQIWMNKHPKPWDSTLESEYHERFSGRREEWLDNGHGDCKLGDQNTRKGLSTRLLSDEANIWSYVIMPNHVHLLVSLKNAEALADWVHALKGGSSFKINRSLGRSGALWAKDYFDRLVRDGEHFRNCARYIRNNPPKAHLSVEQFELFESEYVQQLLR